MAAPPPDDRSPFAGPWSGGESLVAAGGTLGPDLVHDAYRHGVFPWYEAGGPVLWWCPDPRAVLPGGALHVPRRLARTIRRGGYDVRTNTAFDRVVRACAERRPDGTWIHDDVRRVYGALHRRGLAHSLEIWRGETLAGGIYGVAFGAGFAAESMFHRERDASKLAFVHLVRRLEQREFALLDVQFLTPHLGRLGCVEIPREEYLRLVREVRDRPAVFP